MCFAEMTLSGTHHRECPILRPTSLVMCNLHVIILHVFVLVEGSSNIVLVYIDVWFSFIIIFTPGEVLIVKYKNSINCGKKTSNTGQNIQALNQKPNSFAYLNQ
jgi:hypothetical protein